MLFAAIDIGSNAARLLFSKVYEHPKHFSVNKISITRVPTRLGLDVYQDKTISKKRAQKFIKTMKAFSLLIDVYQPQGVVACATAAMREASNSADIIGKVKDKTGLQIHIIDGQEEAELIRLGSRAIVPSSARHKLFIDVGGGSTELSIEREGQLLCQKSFKVGTLRLLSGHAKESVWHDIKTWLDNKVADSHGMEIIGTGGNINKLNKIFGDTDTKVLRLDQLKAAHQQLSPMSLTERMETFALRDDRADVIVPAAHIYLFIMQHIAAKQIIVPKVGLADGLILQQYHANKSFYKHKNP